MKLLLLNDFKIRKKFIIAYFIFIAMIFSLKTIGLKSVEFSFYSDSFYPIIYYKPTNSLCPIYNIQRRNDYR